MATETPKYKILQQDGDFEVRQYEPRIVAEVSVDGEMDTATREGFRILAAYIFGKNAGQQSIAMTAPVTQAADPVKIAMTAPVVTMHAAHLRGQQEVARSLIAHAANDQRVIVRAQIALAQIDPRPARLRSHAPRSHAHAVPRRPLVLV